MVGDSEPEGDVAPSPEVSREVAQGMSSTCKRQGAEAGHPGEARDEPLTCRFTVSGMWHTIFVNTQIEEEPTEAQVEAAVVTLKLLADPTRLRIVWALLHGEHSVNQLASHVGAQPTAVSQHLAKLRLAKLVRTRREANRIMYAAENDHVERIAREALFHGDHVATAGSHHRRRSRTA